MSTKIKSRLFTDKEVKDFRRLCKVYNYRSISTYTDIFADDSDNTNVYCLIISVKQITGTDERNLGNIARLTKSVRLSVPCKNKIVIQFRKRGF